MRRWRRCSRAGLRLRDGRGSGPSRAATESASFAVKFKDEVSPYPLMALFAMPGDTVPLEVVLSDTLAHYVAETGGGRLERAAAPASRHRSMR